MYKMPEIPRLANIKFLTLGSPLTAHDNHRTFALAMSNWPFNTTKSPSGRFTIFSPVPWKKSGAFGSVMPDGEAKPEEAASAPAGEAKAE